MRTTIKTYSELSKLKTFDERFEYLKLKGIVGRDTFGFDRYINQQFYKSYEWKRARDKVIIRDNGCDLGIPGREIPDRILIHHINPIDLEDFDVNTDFLLNPEYLICVSHQTHNAIHYGDIELLPRDPIVRKPNDTSPWR